MNEFCHGIREGNLNILKLNLEKSMAHTYTRQREMWKNLDFVVIDFKEGCFSFLTLFHLNKKHVLVTCSKIMLNITSKLTRGYRV